jgi:hypothetical protein
MTPTPARRKDPATSSRHWRRRTTTAVALLLVSLLGTAAIVLAGPPSAPAPIDPVQFTRIDPADFASPAPVIPALPTTPPPIADFSAGATVDAAIAADRFAQPEVAGKTAAPKVVVKRPHVTTRVGGIATWYCKTGDSPCHYAHSGGMYAAAGAEIRRGDWRGRAVQVCQGGRCIWVTLIDWCACAGNRIIDLYSDAYRKLDPLSGGEMTVTVGW